MKRNIALSIVKILLLPIVFFIILAPFAIYILPVLPAVFVKLFATLACIYLILIFIAGMFFRRAYCYYICPITALFLYIAGRTKNDEILNQNYPKWISRFFFVVWFMGFVYLIYQLLFPNNTDDIYYYFSVVTFYSLLLAACLLSLLLIRNEANHPMCPLIPYLVTGTRIAKSLGLPRLHLKAAPDRCISCHACNKDCFVSLNVDELVKDNLLGTTQKCFNCGRCSHACKSGAISYTFIEK